MVRLALAMGGAATILFAVTSALPSPVFTGTTDRTNTMRTRTAPTRDILWLPQVGQSWQIILNNTIENAAINTLAPSVDIWDLDYTIHSVETFQRLRNAGKKIICYFSAGTLENYRLDKNEFDSHDVGKQLKMWPEERWVNIRSPKVRSIMSRRIAEAASYGCDAIDPDNIDGFVSQVKSKIPVECFCANLFSRYFN